MKGEQEEFAIGRQIFVGPNHKPIYYFHSTVTELMLQQPLRQGDNSENRRQSRCFGNQLESQTKDYQSQSAVLYRRPANGRCSARMGTLDGYREIFRSDFVSISRDILCGFQFFLIFRLAALDTLLRKNYPVARLVILVMMQWSGVFPPAILRAQFLSHT
jgi:hypothetical protein